MLNPKNFSHPSRKAKVDGSLLKAKRGHIFNKKANNVALKDYAQENKIDMGSRLLRLYKKLPESPGVYLMRGKKRKILYIGKAGNLKRRVSSYFSRPLEYRLQKMVNEIKRIDFKRTDTSLEALILESQLIKKYKPPFNVREKDDKSFLYVEFTKEEIRVIPASGELEYEFMLFYTGIPAR